MGNTQQDYSIMFVDVVDSTALKYKEGPAKIASIMANLYSIIDRSSKDKANITYTGDGAMVIFVKNTNGCFNALNSAEKILQYNDLQNIIQGNRIQIRIGIATGECYKVSEGVAKVEISGKFADLAARLCSDTEPDTILIDKSTKQFSKMADHRFKICDRRLPLKGVKLSSNKPESFYYFKPNRFLRPRIEEPNSKGLLALYPNRTALSRDFRPERIIWLSAKNSTVLVAGRTLIYWIRLRSEMQFAVKNKGIKFKFLISSENTADHLDSEQKREIKRDLPIARNYFLELVRNNPGHFELKETNQLILDGVTCAEVMLPSDNKNNGQNHILIALQDINAAHGKNKAALLLACSCDDKDSKPDISCLAHGLYERTELLYKLAKVSGISPQKSELEDLLRNFSEGLNSRNNHISQYIHKMRPYFDVLKFDRLNKTPYPICIQFQVSSRCSTQCVMCDHWVNDESSFDDTNRKELELDE